MPQILLIQNEEWKGREGKRRDEMTEEEKKSQTLWF